MRIISLGILMLTTAAVADPTLSVEVGWGGRLRPGRWAPIYVTVSDSKSRNAILDLYAPHDGAQAMEIRLPVVVSPTPQTYEMYAPLVGNGDPTKLTLRNAGDGKYITDTTVVDPFGVYEGGHGNGPFTFHTGPFIGVSGAAAAFASLEKGSDSPTVAYLPPSRLPRAWRGYDTLDVLVLNQPDLVSMSADRQGAIRDWVNVGGELVIWPGEGVIPPRGPIVDLLPATIGAVATANVGSEELERLGLSNRFEHFTIRKLTAVDGAAVKPVLGPDAVAATIHRGLGKVTLLNFNAGALVFTDDRSSFYDSFLDLPARSGNTGTEIQSYQASSATGAVMDLLGDVPGVGTFGFGYVAFAVLGLMAVVGPLDWFVLKRMRRQQWTWVTMAGWIALVTFIALSLGKILRSGDLHFRTISIVDQVDNHVIGRTDALGLYSPRTTEYRFDVPDESWWEPMSTDTFAYGREVVAALPFIQTADTNYPAEDTVHVWNLRMLVGNTASTEAPWIKADFSMSGDSVRGTLTNLSGQALTHLWLRTSSGVFDLTKQGGFPKDGLAGGAAMKIGFVPSYQTPGYSGFSMPARNSSPHYFGATPAASKVGTPLEIVESVNDLAYGRSRRIDDCLQHSDSPWAVIYAEMQPAEGPEKLAEGQPIKKNWKILRALVPIRDEK